MKRLITGFSLAGLLFIALFITDILWLGFVLLFTIGGAIEFSSIQFKNKVPYLSALVITSAVVFPCNTYFRLIGWPFVDDVMIIIAIFILAPTLFIMNRGEIDDFKLSVPMAVWGSIWIGYMFSYLLPMKWMTMDGQNYGVQIIFVFTYIVCSNDVGAYYFGSTYGKNKLSEVYSPRKTWEGVIGGIGFAFFSALLCKFTFAPKFKIWQLVILTLAMVGAGIMGDLVESVFKRSCKVKDTGEILPGHGGIMDRIDATLFAAPTFFWIMHFLVVN